MIGSGPRLAGPHGTVLIVVSSIVVLALAMVAPVDGQSGTSDHRFQLVHPIFPHVHLAGDDDHHLIDAESDVAAPGDAPGSTMLPVGPLGPGPLITTEGMHLPTPWAMPGRWPTIRLAWNQRRLVTQTSPAVPTGPPR